MLSSILVYCYNIGVLVNQRPGIITNEEVMGFRDNSVTFSYRLFVGTHVPDMYIPNIHFNLTNESDLPEVPQCLTLSEAMYSWN